MPLYWLSNFNGKRESISCKMYDIAIMVNQCERKKTDEQPNRLKAATGEKPHNAPLPTMFQGTLANKNRGG